MVAATNIKPNPSVEISADLKTDEHKVNNTSGLKNIENAHLSDGKLG